MIPALLTVLGALFSAVGKLFEFLYAQKLVDAGKVQAQLESLRKQVEDAQAVITVREAVRADDLASGGKLPIDDPFRRD